MGCTMSRSQGVLTGRQKVAETGLIQAGAPLQVRQQLLPCRRPRGGQLVRLQACKVSRQRIRTPWKQQLHTPPAHYKPLDTGNVMHPTQGSSCHLSPGPLSHISARNGCAGQLPGEN